MNDLREPVSRLGNGYLNCPYRLPVTSLHREVGGRSWLSVLLAAADENGKEHKLDDDLVLLLTR